MRRRPFSAAALVCYVLSMAAIFYSLFAAHITPIGWFLRVVIVIYLTWRMDSIVRRFYGDR